MSIRYAQLARLIGSDRFPAPVPAELLAAVTGLAAARQARRAVPVLALPTAASAPGINPSLITVAPVAYAQQLAADLVAGKPLPTDLFEASYAAAVQDAKARAADTVVAHTLVSVENTVDRVASDCKPELLAGLRAELATVVEQAQATIDALEGYDVSDPRHLVTARDSIRAAYAKLPDHIAAYDAIRRAQDAVQEPDHAAGPGRDLWTSATRAGWFEIQDVPGFWPLWASSRAIDGPTAPWPDDPRARLVAVLAFDPWLPDDGQVLRAMNDALEGRPLNDADAIPTAGTQDERRRRRQLYESTVGTSAPKGSAFFGTTHDLPTAAAAHDGGPRIIDVPAPA